MLKNKSSITMCLLLASLAVSCGGANQAEVSTPTVEAPQPETAPPSQPPPQPDSPSPNSSVNPFDKVKFPQASCGDKLPEDENAYPVEFYPVFIDYTEQNLEAVTSRFCNDALKNRREELGKDAIQVASFIGKERAEHFKSLMVREFGGGDVGKATVVSKRKTESESTTETAEADSPKAGQADNVQLQSTEAIGKAAGLTASQITQLLSLERSTKNKVIVPTRLPPGYQVIGVTTDEVGVMCPQTYKIDYRSPQGRCFEVINYPLCGDAPIGHDSETIVSSPALGNLNLGYTERHDNVDGTLISSEPVVVKGNGELASLWDDEYEINFAEGDYFFAFYSATKNEKSCQATTLQEAIEVVKSLQLLNP